MNDKIPAFEYILYLLNEWYREECPDRTDNDISILKAMKLLFFVASVQVEGDETDLLDIFDFQAWTYGHVESDIYNSRRNLNNITLDRFHLSIRDEEEIINWASNHIPLSSRIERSVNALRRENKDLITWDAFKLVNLSHSYFSWIYYFNYLESPDAIIPIQTIRNERKYYS